MFLVLARGEKMGVGIVGRAGHSRKRSMHKGCGIEGGVAVGQRLIALRQGRPGRRAALDGLEAVLLWREALVARYA